MDWNRPTIPPVSIYRRLNVVAKHGHNSDTMWPATPQVCAKKSYTPFEIFEKKDVEEFLITRLCKRDNYGRWSGMMSTNGGWSGDPTPVVLNICFSTLNVVGVFYWACNCNSVKLLNEMAEHPPLIAQKKEHKQQNTPHRLPRNSVLIYKHFLTFKHHIFHSSY
jgi:hypothetical protein